jgi:hypothetical protein
VNDPTLPTLFSAQKIANISFKLATSYPTDNKADNKMLHLNSSFLAEIFDEKLSLDFCSTVAASIFYPNFAVDHLTDCIPCCAA